MRYGLKDLSVDTEARLVCRNNVAIKLPDLSFDLLVTLIEATPEPVSNLVLCREVWRREHVSDETVAQRITLLRKALGDNTKEPTYIRTVRGLGYAVVGPVEFLENVTTPHIISFLKYPGTLAVAAFFAILFLSIAMFSNIPMANTQHETTTVGANQKSSATILIERAQEQLRLHQARETDRAIVMLREVLTQKPDSFDARLTLSFALSTKATKFGGGLREKLEAESLARTLIREQPESSNAWSALGYTLSAQGQPNESLSAYQYAYHLNPENAPALSSAAHVLLLRGDLQQALVLEARAKKAGGTSRYAEIQIAQILELIDHPAATAWRMKALSLNPGQVVVLSEVAKSYLRQGNPMAALKILEQAEGEDQSAPQIMYLRGRAAIMLGRLKEARLILENIGWRGHYELAALDGISGNTSRAQALFLPSKRAELEFDPDPATHIKLAEITATLGQESEVLRLIGHAINLGWRDINWLKQSPYLSTLMSSNQGREIESRIERELDVQRRLIEGTKELTSILAN